MNLTLQILTCHGVHSQLRFYNLNSLVEILFQSDHKPLKSCGEVKELLIPFLQI